jgi:hypothetical protein
MNKIPQYDAVARRERFLLPGIVLAAFILGLISFAMYRILVVPRGNAFDFYTLWYGGRVFWRGGNPYSLETARAIQRAVFGRILPAGVNQQGFAYPAYAVVMLVPLVAIPFPLAASIWSALQLVGIAAAAVLTLGSTRGIPRPLSLGLWVLAAYAFRYAMIVVVIGQTSVAVWLGIAASVYLYHRRCDFWSGVCLALASLRPELGGPVGLALVVLALVEGRSRLLGGWAGSLAALSLVAMLRRPGWPLDFLAGLTAYAGYAPVLWPPALFPPWGWLAAAVTVAACGYALARSWPQVEHRPALFVAALLPLLLAFIPQTGSYTLTLALFTGLVAARHTDSMLTRWLVTAMLLAPWAILIAHYRTGHTPLEIEHVVVPLLAALALFASLLPHRRAA